MGYAVWGAGHRGEIVHRILGGDAIACFIDSSPDKQEKPFCGKPVVSYAAWKAMGSRDIVVVSPFMSADIEKTLDSDGVPYFLLDECPPEFMGFGIQKAERHWDSLLAKVCDHAALYGVSLYTVWLLDCLKARGKEDVVLVRQPHAQKALLDRLSGLPVTDIVRAQKEGRQLYVCFYDDCFNDRIMPPSFVDLFDLSKGIVPHRNERIEKFRGSQKGRRCFVVATGPSLRMEDLDVLGKNGEFCISMNSIFYMFDRTSWRPDCYCVSDGLGIDIWKQKLLELPLKHIFIGDSVISLDYDSLPDNFYTFHVMTGRFWRTSPGVSDDFAARVYPGNTITSVCIQLAMYMGFSEIYLLGVDFNYKPGNQNHISSGDDPDEPTFSASFVSESDRWVLGCYKALRGYAGKRGIHIYNATRGGKLEVFERVDFDGLFGRFEPHGA